MVKLIVNTVHGVASMLQIIRPIGKERHKLRGQFFLRVMEAECSRQAHRQITHKQTPPVLQKVHEMTIVTFTFCEQLIRLRT
jgi:hypothetical protein